MRAYRRQVPPKSLPPLGKAAAPLPGVPPAWCAGVALLATLPPPDAIEPRRWAALAASSARLLREHGAELHRAGWDALDLFGLHRHAPVTNPPGWGLAWLLEAAGEVLDVSCDAVGMRRTPGGARLTYRRWTAAAWAEVVPAWALQSRGRDGCLWKQEPVPLFLPRQRQNAAQQPVKG